MKTSYLCVMITMSVMALFASCNNKRPNTQSTSETVAVTDKIDTHNSRNSLDYEGTYTGTLPCADCSGIYTEIALSGNNYTVKTVYQGKGNEDENVESGLYVWDNTGSIITLGNDSLRRYQVGENALFVLDEDGNRMQGDLAAMYILRKKQ